MAVLVNSVLEKRRHVGRYMGIEVLNYHAASFFRVERTSLKRVILIDLRFIQFQYCYQQLAVTFKQFIYLSSHLTLSFLTSVCPLYFTGATTLLSLLTCILRTQTRCLLFP